MTFTEAKGNSQWVRWSGDGKFLVSGPHRYNEAFQIYTRAGEHVAELPRGHEPTAHLENGQVTINPKGLKPGQEISLPFHELGLVGRFYTPDRSTIVRFDSNGDMLRFYDVATRKLDRLVFFLADGQFATFSVAGELLYATPGATDQVTYTVEERDGRRTLLDHKAFLSRADATER